jgi:hypothetical protein
MHLSTTKTIRTQATDTFSRTEGAIKKKVKSKKTEGRMRNFLLFTFCFLLFFSLCPLHGAGLALPKTAGLVPPETFVLLDVGNFALLKAQFEKTSLYRLYKDPAMYAFVEDAKAKWQEKVRKMDDNSIFKAFFSADAAPEGRAALAIVPKQQPADSNGQSFLLLTQWGEKISQIKETVAKMRSKNIEYGGYQKSSETYRGVTIEISVDETASTLSYCFIDDCFIAATDITLLKFVIAHIKGADSPTLADDTDYVAATAAAGPYHDMDFYVNIKQIIKTELAQDATGGTAAAIKNLGLDNVAALSSSLSLARSRGGSSSATAFVKINGAKKGLCNMLEAESSLIKSPRFIGASAYSLTFLNLDIKKAYNELYNILYSFSPASASLMYAPVVPPSPDGKPGLYLKNDFIEYLGSELIIARSINKPFSKDSAPTESLVALATVNRSALEKSLSLLHSSLIAPTDPDARREFLGHTIYLIGLPNIPFTAPGMTPMQDYADTGTSRAPKMAFTVTDTHLIFGAEPAVERAIRTLSGSASSSAEAAKWFNDARAALPAVGLACLQDNTASAELFWWMTKENAKSVSSVLPGVSVSLGFGLPNISDLVNFELLPQFDVVRKYFGLSVSYGLSRPDGFFFEFKDISTD